MVLERGGLWLVSDTAVDRVDAMLYHCLTLLLSQFATYDIRCSAFDNRLFGIVKQTDALLGTVGTLVELSGEVLHRKAEVIGTVRKLFKIHVIHRRFAKHCSQRRLESFVRKIFNIITYQDTHFVGLNVEVVEHFALQFFSLDAVSRLFLNINSSYFIHILNNYFSL